MGISRWPSLPPMARAAAIVPSTWACLGRIPQSQPTDTGSRIQGEIPRHSHLHGTVDLEYGSRVQVHGTEAVISTGQGQASGKVQRTAGQGSG
jgi:hypothetical protein